jgi:eukaryotic-like serine/threonine-protein kinase
MTTLDPGRVFDRYEVLGTLGKGGMASVYRVRHLVLGHQRALKVLDIGRRVDERLVREGVMQASLQHPNMVGVHDVVDVDGRPGLIMDLVDGPDLEEWLRRERPPLAARLAVFNGVLAAMGMAHAGGIVHRDLKPANILVDLSGPSPVARVTDFGIAKLMDPDEGRGGGTRTGSALGTPAYMAPEQIRDASRVDHRADIWSLGCILYRLVTDRMPFEGDSVLEVWDRVVNGPLPDPRTTVPNVSAQLAATIATALERDVDRRFKSVKAMEAALRGEGDHIPGRPSTPGWADSTIDVPTTARPTRARHLGPIVAAGVLLLGALAAAWTGRQTAGIEAVEPESDAPGGTALGPGTEEGPLEPTAPATTTTAAPAPAATRAMEPPKPATNASATAAVPSVVSQGTEGSASSGSSSSSDGPLPIHLLVVGEQGYQDRVREVWVVCKQGRQRLPARLDSALGCKIEVDTGDALGPLGLGPFTVAPGGTITVTCTAAGDCSHDG